LLVEITSAGILAARDLLDLIFVKNQARRFL